MKIVTNRTAYCMVPASFSWERFVFHVQGVTYDSYVKNHVNKKKQKKKKKKERMFITGFVFVILLHNASCVLHCDTCEV